MRFQIGSRTMVVALILILAVGSLAWAAEAEKVNINSASIDELTQLQRIGPKTAERIVAYREQNGPFKAPEDLMRVKGVGQKIFELNKNRIVVAD